MPESKKSDNGDAQATKLAANPYAAAAKRTKAASLNAAATNAKDGTQNAARDMGQSSQNRTPATKKVRERRRYQLACYASKPIPGQCLQCRKEAAALARGKRPPNRAHDVGCPRRRKPPKEKTMGTKGKKAAATKSTKPKVAKKPPPSKAKTVKGTGVLPNAQGITAESKMRFINGAYVRSPECQGGINAVNDKEAKRIRRQNRLEARETGKEARSLGLEHKAGNLIGKEGASKFFGGDKEFKRKALQRHKEVIEAATARERQRREEEK